MKSSDSSKTMTGRRPAASTKPPTIRLNMRALSRSEEPGVSRAIKD
jgi:hypothetical protein